VAIGFWNDINTEKAKRGWAEGKSASQIGAEIGCTRNAVIGRIHRLGLASRAANHRIQTAKTVRARRRKHTLQSVNSRRQQSGAELYASYEAYEADRASKLEEYEALKALPDVDVPIAERRGVKELLDKQCRWPIGDPQHKDFHYCNGTQVPGLPYCAQHCSRAFVPPDPRRPRDPSDRLLARNSRFGALVAKSAGQNTLHRIYPVDARTFDLLEKEPA
jgi:GcrA cell cycle regulator